MKIRICYLRNPPLDCHKINQNVTKETRKKSFFFGAPATKGGGGGKGLATKEK